MAFAIMGQVFPPGATDTVLFTCPYQQFVASTLFVCNTGGGATFRIHIVQDGDTTSQLNAIYYDTAINANDTLAVTAGITLELNDAIVVRSSTGTVAFSLFGDGQGSVPEEGE